MNGVINICKEEGFTSFDVVAKLKGILHTRKIGHTGTLDPMATGVLPVCVGNATGLVALLTEKDKTYKAGIKLGITTDTLDITGEVLYENPECAVKVTEDSFKNAALKYTGAYDQLPPMYSALKVNGKKLYEYAREGKEVERKPRSVKIHSIDTLEFYNTEAVIRVSCSKGTYIRSLIDDIGRELNCGAVMTSLVREKSGDFELKDAYTLSEIEELVKKDDFSFLIPVDKILNGYEALYLKADHQKLISNGNRLPADSFNNSITPVDGALYRIYDAEGNFAAVYKYSDEKQSFVTEKMFKRY
ncbi:MAG: tRNA pseudouridine(55) synthase TruB [Lachnospiraceae bacterium]|nr:tRNA pseudouridine(55) synthase TruB [Lachnospiraceae bacterium]